MITNAQAALQAAATMFTGKDVSPNTVQGLATNLKRWLDRMDAADQAVETKEEPLQAQLERQMARPAPKPGPVHVCNAQCDELAAQAQSFYDTEPVETFTTFPA